MTKLTRRQFCAASGALWPAAAALSCAGAAPTVASTAGPPRQDHRISGDQGIELFVREVRPPARGRPLLLLHGARVPGVASFDLPVPGGSLAGDLAAAGHHVFILDARGYGGSTRPPEMERPPEGGDPLVRSSEVVRDIAAAVEWIRRRLAAPRVALLGWATGGHWLGHYTSLYSDRVSHLVIHNSLYGGTPEHPTLGRGSDLEDPARPGRFNRAAIGAYRLNAAPSLLGAWERSIPSSDKAEWRDPAVAEAYVAAALASDTTSATRSPTQLPRPERRARGQLLPGHRPPAVGRLSHPLADAGPALGAGFLDSPGRPPADDRAPRACLARRQPHHSRRHSLRPPGSPGARARPVPRGRALVPGRLTAVSRRALNRARPRRRVVASRPRGGR